MKYCVHVVAGLTSLAGLLGEFVPDFTGDARSQTLRYIAQQGVPSKPGVPSKQPGPQSPQPTPSTQPQPAPGSPGQQPPPRDNDPAQPGDANRPSTPVPAGAAPSVSVGARYLRPFAFDHPDNEARFTESSRRLMQFEQRLERSNQDLMKRLGEARQLGPDRQSAALFEILQQMLMDQSDMQRYLVQARTAWSGELETPEEPAANPNRGRSPMRESAPATNVQPGNQPASPPPPGPRNPIPANSPPG